MFVVTRLKNWQEISHKLPKQAQVSKVEANAAMLIGILSESNQTIAPPQISKIKHMPFFPNLGSIGNNRAALGLTIGIWG